MTIIGSESWWGWAEQNLGYNFSEFWMPVGTFELFRELERIGGSTGGAGHG